MGRAGVFYWPLRICALLVGESSKMTNSITCPNCKTRFVQVGKTKKTYQSTPQQFIGNDAGSLRQTQPVPTPRQLPSLPSWTGQSKTGQRVVQTGVSCAVVGALFTWPGVITVTGATVWFGSMLGGIDNWSVLHKFLDRNRDGKVNRKDVEHIVNNVLDNVLEDAPPASPPIPVHVIRGTETTMGQITGATQEQLHEAAKVMFSEVNKGEAFARSRVGKIFGADFSQVQKEMVKLKLLEGNDNAGYKLTPEGLIFLGRYHSSPSPTPDE